MFKSGSLVLLTFVLAWGCATAPRDACSLLTPTDLQEIQGETPIEVKANNQGTFQQCFYRLPTFANSINLGVAREGRELWERAESGEEKAREIPGLGDKALWSSFQIGATLYVLKGDTMLRIGIGGKDTDAVRLEKATALARRALKRLR